MRNPPRFRFPHLLALQAVGVLLGLGCLYLAPPVEGRIMLLPVTAQGRTLAASVAVAHGARIVAAGPWAGSMLVDGRRDRLVAPLLARGVVTVAARAIGCGGAQA